MNKVLIPNVRVLVEPASRAVSLAEAKLWCRVDHADDDAVIGLIVQAAEERCESLLGRALVERQLELRLDGFPDDVIELPYPPLQSVQYIRYLDPSGAWQTLSGSPQEWHEDTGSEPGRIQPLSGASWPATQTGTIGAVQIGYTCGYAAAGSPLDPTASIPAAAKLWMQTRVSTMYDNRSQLVMGNIVKVPRDFVDGLLDGLSKNKNFA